MKTIRRLFRLTVAIMTVSIGAFLGGVGWAQRPSENALAIVVTPRGIFPSRVSLRPGPLSVSVINRTGYARAQYQIRQATDGKIVSSASIDPLIGRSARASTQITLTPGEYDFTLVGQPGVSCRIVVRP